MSVAFPLAPEREECGHQPQVPPADAMSSAKARTAPNWVLKTAMAATGVALAIVLVIWLVINLWSSNITLTGVWLWALLCIVSAVFVVHVGIGVVLTVRSKTGRGPKRATLHGGWHAWLTRLMPYTGAAILLITVLALLNLLPKTMPWGAVVIIFVLVIIAAHVLHGLGTVATIAAGGGQLGTRIKRVLVIGGGVVIGALLLANLWILLSVLGGSR